MLATHNAFKRYASEQRTEALRSIQLNKFKGEGWMDFYLTINSRLVREKRWYKNINRLP